MAGKRGPKHKPSAVHRLRGNPSKLTQAELKRREGALPKEGDCAPPDDISPVAQVFWDYYIVELEGMGVMRPAYQAALSEMCEFLAEVRAHRSALRDHFEASGSYYIHTKEAGLKNHPALVCGRAASQMALRYMAELGLTPSSTTRLGVAPETQEIDSLEAMLRQVEGGQN